MHAIQVSCPLCFRPFDVDELMRGHHATCPHCQGLVLVPGGEEADSFPAPSRARMPHQRPDAAWSFGMPWSLCEILTILAALVHVLLLFVARSVLDQIFASAAAAAWVITFYVLARCHEKRQR
jgi:hypothetical protein